MCFSLQRRAIFPHRNFKKWSEHGVFCTFWLENVLLATAACNFSTSQLQKVVRECCVLYILTCKCASRHSGVQFFMSSLNSHLRTRRFNEVTFRPSRHTKHWKTQHFATSLTFHACWSSFFPHLLIFFLAALLFQLSILSEVRLLNFLWLLLLIATNSHQHHPHPHHRGGGYHGLGGGHQPTLDHLYPESVATNLEIMDHWPLCATSISLFAILILAMQRIPHNETLQVQASASKLQQLPWTTVFEDLQLLLRSADAPGLTP